MDIDLNAVRQALGIKEDDDPIVAIGNMRDQITELQETVKADSRNGQQAETVKLRREVTDLEKRYVKLENTFTARVAELEEENRNALADSKVDAAILTGKIKPAQRDFALRMARRDPKDFEEFMTSMKGVDLSERGVASDDDISLLEPTEAEVAVARSLGTWNDADPKASRLNLMKTKAAEKGLTMPVEAK